MGNLHVKILFGMLEVCMVEGDSKKRIIPIDIQAFHENLNISFYE